MSGGQDENSSHDNAIGWAIMLVVLAALVYIFWKYFHTEVRDLVRWIRYGQMWLVEWGLQVLEALGLYEGGYTVNFNGQETGWRRGFNDTPRFSAEELTYFHLSYFTALTMQPLQYFYAGILGLMAFWALRYSPKTLYREKMGLERVIARQAQNFPVTAPFVEFNPSKLPPRPPGSPVPAELPLFAEALGPEEWLAFNQIPVIEGGLDEDALRQAFEAQLGKRWLGSKKLDPYKQIMLAAFCLKAARKRNDADALMGRLALCWDHKKGLVLSRDRKLLKEARAILANKKMSAGTLEVANNHAFEVTALLRALEYCREEGGVMAPGQFVWLRGYDRALWYPLNNLGRDSFHPEALGALSHYKIEKLTNRPIPVPKVQNAVDNIKAYMASDSARPIQQLDYSASTSKRGVKKAV